MAVAAPARRSSAATAAPPKPSRPPAKQANAAAAAPAKTSPARKRPLRPTRGRPKVAAGTAAPARKAPARKPATRKAPGKTAARKAPAKAAARKAAPRGSASRSARATASRSGRATASATRGAQAAAPLARATAQRAVAGGQLIPLAVGRTAVAVSQLPDSGLVVRLTRGRAWIGLLGVLLVGIVALNVVTLSFAASAGKYDEGISTLEAENSILRGRDAQRSGIGAVRNAAGPLGLSMPSSDGIRFIDANHGVVAAAAARLAAAGG